MRSSAWVVAAVFLWLALAGSAEIAEAFMAAAAATLTAFLVRSGSAEAPVRFTPRWRWLRAALRLPGPLARDCWIVFRALVKEMAVGRRPSGKLRALRFRPTRAADEASAREALTTAGISLLPNSYVIGIDREEELLLIHELVPGTGEPPS